MSNRFPSQIAQVATALDGVFAEARATETLRARAAAINANLGKTSHGLESSSTRIANALAQMAESGTQLRAAEARLAFQGARLKRSSKAIRTSLGQLRAAGDVLEQRAREARAVAETADRTATLITAIESAAARGEAFDHLVATANDIAQTSGLRRAN
jgi:chromosome segregation ATPase